MNYSNIFDRTEARMQAIPEVINLRTQLEATIQKHKDLITAYIQEHIGKEYFVQNLHDSAIDIAFNTDERWPSGEVRTDGVTLYMGYDYRNCNWDKKVWGCELNVSARGSFSITDGTTDNMKYYKLCGGILTCGNDLDKMGKEFVDEFNSINDILRETYTRESDIVKAEIAAEEAEAFTKQKAEDEKIYNKNKDSEDLFIFAPTAESNATFTYRKKPMRLVFRKGFKEYYEANDYYHKNHEEHTYWIPDYYKVIPMAKVRMA